MSRRLKKKNFTWGDGDFHAQVRPMLTLLKAQESVNHALAKIANLLLTLNSQKWDFREEEEEGWLRLEWFLPPTFSFPISRDKALREGELGGRMGWDLEYCSFLDVGSLGILKVLKGIWENAFIIDVYVTNPLMVVTPLGWCKTFCWFFWITAGSVRSGEKRRWSQEQHGPLVILITACKSS